jgi:O-antigen/teichoic acid export membrane protein
MSTAVDRDPADRPPLSPGMGFAALSFVANASVALVSAVVTSRLYGVEVIGRYALAITPWLLLVSISTVSEQVAMVRALATMRPGSPQVTGVFFAVLSMSSGMTALMSVLVLAVSVAALSGPVDHVGVLGPAVLIVAGYVLFENPAWNLDSVLSAFSQGRRLFWCRLASIVAFLIGAVAFRAVTDDVWGLALANVVSFAIGLLCRVGMTRDLLGPFPKSAEYREGLRQLPGLLRFGVRMLPAQLFIGLTLQAPVWIVASSVSLARVGAYSRAATMAVLNEASFRINEMLFPDLVRLRGKGDDRAFAGALSRSLRLSLAGLLLAAAVGGGAANGVMWFFGDGFEEGAGALGWLLLAHVAYVAASITASAYTAMGAPQLNSAFSLIRLVVGLSLVLALTPHFDVTGAAAALFVGYLAELAVRVLCLRRALGPSGRRVLEPSVAFRLLLVFGCSFAITRVVSTLLGSGPAGFGVALLAGTATFALVAVLTDLVDAGERRSLEARVRRLVRRGVPAA